MNSCYLIGWRLSVPCWSHAGLCFLIAQETDQASKNSRSLAVSTQSCDYCCTPRAWQLLRKLPKRPVSALRVIPIPCLLRLGVKREGNGLFHYCFPISPWIAFYKSSNSQSREWLRYRENLTMISKGAVWAHDTGLLPYFYLRKTAWGDGKKG